MKRSLPVRILAAGLLLAAALVGLVAYEAQARAGGREVLLAMEAFDPRSLLSGHYASLQLAHTLPVGAPCPSAGDKPAHWLALGPDGPAHRLVGVAETRREALAIGQIALRGRASCRPVSAGEDAPVQQAVNLDIGVERFHADQQEAEEIERRLGDALAGGPPAAFAVISVGRDGRGRLKGVVIEGRRTDLTWF